VPTISEGGVPDYEAATWYALLAPANTPQTGSRDRLSRQGLETTGSSR